MTEMNARERYLAVMNFDPDVRTLLWEFGYWTATMERWYGEGLARTPYSPPPGHPEGSGVIAEALSFPFPTHIVRYRDVDVHRILGLDDGVVRIPLNWRLCPAFDVTVLEEDVTTQTMINADGVTICAKKASDSLPQFLSGPVSDRKSWEQIKEERFNTDNIMMRFPDRWEKLAPTYRNRDYPLGLQLDGFFSLPRELFLVEHQLMAYYTQPDLMHDIGRQIFKVWMAVLEEVLSRTDLDFVYFWEDMSFKNGPLVSPQLFEEFITPYYKQMTQFLDTKGIKIRCVDTDGDCWLLLPGFVKAGITGLYPFECNAGMDVVAVRKAYPQLQIMGGLDKTKVAKGKTAIDAELDAKLPAMLAQGGYIPHIDHLVPPDVSWDDFLYYRQRVGEYVERSMIHT